MLKSSESVALLFSFNISKSTVKIKKTNYGEGEIKDSIKGLSYIYTLYLKNNFIRTRALDFRKIKNISRTKNELQVVGNFKNNAFFNRDEERASKKLRTAKNN